MTSRLLRMIRSWIGRVRSFRVRLPSRPPLTVQSIRRLGVGAALLLLVSISAATLLSKNQTAVRHILAHWTGEDELTEQIKGVGALAYLRLASAPPRTDPFVPVAHVGLSPYGINTFLEQEADISQVERSLEMISSAGFDWIRQEFPWEDIEISAKGDYWDHQWGKSAWAKYDRIVEMAERYDLEIIVRLDNPPAWTRAVGDAPGWSMAPPDDLEDYGDYVHAVVSRYKGRIHYYQIWNEPNIYPEWGDQPTDPAGYVELLKVGYRRAKEADPECAVIAAGLAQTVEETPAEFGPRNMSDLLYLEEMYRAGAQGHFDIMGAQVYGLWTGPYDRRASRDRTNFSRAQLLREIMVRHGDADKPIWATEVGWNSVPEDFPAFPNYGRVGQEKQAIYAVEAYRRAAREWPWMGVMNYWFFRRPSEAEKGQTWYYFRMVEPDFRALPVYGAMSWLMNRQQYQGAPPPVQAGYHQQDHWALNYAGPWRHVADDSAVLGAYALADQGAELDLFFEGTDLALVIRGSDLERSAGGLGDLDLTLDGRALSPASVSWPQKLLGAARALPGAGEGTDSVAVPIARALPEGRHTLGLTAADGPIGLDGVVVWRQSPLRNVALLLGVMASVTALAAMAASLGSEPVIGERER